MKMPTAGIVIAPPSKKNAPGNMCNVAMYIEAYIGVQTTGTRAATTPNSELTFPAYFE